MLSGVPSEWLGRERELEMKLFFSPGASSLSVHIALREAGLSAELVRVDLESKTIAATGEDYYRVHPLGKVPALMLDDGVVLTEGVAILMYIASLAPETCLAPASTTLDHFRMIEILSFVATELHKGFSPMFDPDVPASFKQHLMSDPRPFSKIAALVDQGPFVIGQHFTIADAYLYSILRLGQHAGLDFSRWPKIGPYINQVSSRPSVREASRAEGLVGT